jgi:glycogen phosphorylase
MREEPPDMPAADEIDIAYFSMEIAADPDWPTYAGGLGVLAGDFLRSAADRGIPIVGVTLLPRHGYFRQHLDELGRQSEAAESWSPESVLEPLAAVVSVNLCGRDVRVRAWRHSMTGVTGHRVSVYFLDVDLPENSPAERALTGALYGGDSAYRLCQEAVLGIGGIRLLGALGHNSISRFHMNEGHPALLALALLEQEIAGREDAGVTPEEVDGVRQKCVFTTHTPVPAAFDRFSLDLAQRILGKERMERLVASGSCPDGNLNMTYLALRFSRYINGVAMHHGEISHTIFPNYPMHAITNGVHAVRWTSAPFRELYDRHIPEWRCDNLYLRYAIGIPLEEIRQAHILAKHSLLRAVAEATGTVLDEDVLTIGFGRRAAEYKRPDLIFSDLNRLCALREKSGPLQLIFGGKAHPSDEAGKVVIRKIAAAAAALRESIPVVYIENYDMRWAGLFTAGVDLWLNTPHRPLEASGTSGMKAAMNGVPSLSVRDGWWVEGHFEGATGWSIGYDEDPELREIEVASLYDKLEHTILPLYYSQPTGYPGIMRSAIALNGSFFNTQRMLSQYVVNAYYPQPEAATDPGTAHPATANGLVANSM